MSEYVERQCRRCIEGRVYVGTATEPKTEVCPDCRGTGKVLSFLYPKPKGRRGPWPPREVVTETRWEGMER